MEYPGTVVAQPKLMIERQIYLPSLFCEGYFIILGWLYKEYDA